MQASRAERLAAAILILGAFAVVLAVVPHRSFELDRFFLPKEVVLHATALLVALLVIPGRREWTWTRVDLCLLAYLGLTIISAAFATNGWLALRAVAITWSGLLLFWSTRELSRAGLGRILTLGLAAGAVLGVLTALGQAYGLVDSDLFSLTRAPGGTFGNRNFVAHLAAIILPALLAIALTARHRFGYLLSVLATLLTVGLLVLTRSRAAWLATALSGSVFVLLGFFPGGLWRDAAVRRRLVGPLLAVAAGAVLALNVPNALDWRSDTPYVDTLKGLTNYQEGSGRGRLLQWRNSLALVRADPVLGVGPGNWAVEYPAVVTPDDPSLDSEGMAANPWPSSDWMAVLSERGLLAFLLLTCAGGLLFLTGARAWLASPRGVQDLAPLVLASTVAAAAVVGAFDAVLLLPVPALYVWSLAGSLLPVDPFPERRPAGWRSRVVVAALVLAVGLAVTWRSVRQVQAMELIAIWGRLSTRAEAAALDPGSYRIQVMVAQSYRRRGRCKDAIPFAQQAARLFPEAAEPRAILRACGQR
ncbi:MAG TPA: O-antigen ligase family protein [Gemmatimonadales bacterium]|nr:O-antigen ligase family protein [Gemmatimonadales bacterium]